MVKSNLGATLFIPRAEVDRAIYSSSGLFIDISEKDFIEATENFSLNIQIVVFGRMIFGIVDKDTNTIMSTYASTLFAPISFANTLTKISLSGDERRIIRFHMCHEKPYELFELLTSKSEADKNAVIPLTLELYAAPYYYNKIKGYRVMIEEAEILSAANLGVDIFYRPRFCYTLTKDESKEFSQLKIEEVRLDKDFHNSMAVASMVHQLCYKKNADFARFEQMYLFFTHDKSAILPQTVLDDKSSASVLNAIVSDDTNFVGSLVDCIRVSQHPIDYMSDSALYVSMAEDEHLAFEKFRELIGNGHNDSDDTSKSDITASNVSEDAESEEEYDVCFDRFGNAGKSTVVHEPKDVDCKFVPFDPDELTDRIALNISIDDDSERSDKDGSKFFMEDIRYAISKCMVRFTFAINDEQWYHATRDISLSKLSGDGYIHARTFRFKIINVVNLNMDNGINEYLLDLRHIEEDDSTIREFYDNIIEELESESPKCSLADVSIAGDLEELKDISVHDRSFKPEAVTFYSDCDIVTISQYCKKFWKNISLEKSRVHETMSLTKPMKEWVFKEAARFWKMGEDSAQAVYYMSPNDASKILVKFTRLFKERISYDVGILDNHDGRYWTYNQISSGHKPVDSGGGYYMYSSVEYLIEAIAAFTNYLVYKYNAWAIDKLEGVEANEAIRDMTLLDRG